MKSTYRNTKKNEVIEKVINILLPVVRILLGLVFLFSGFVKAIDPLGSTYKFDDYFVAFGGFFHVFTAISFPLAILLSTIELVIGLSLLFKLYIRITNLMALLFMLVMTPLTLYIAIKENLVSDCGCFGDALVISNWATFYKNLVLISMVIFLLFYQKQIHSFFTKISQRVLFSFFILIGVGLSVYSYRHLPLIDFRPYKVGVNIPKAMEIPEGAKLDEYQTTFFYQKDGIQKEFTLENYPKGDSTWKFVDQKTVLISKGFKAPIHDFTILDPNYEDITGDVLENNGKTYLLIMYDLNESSEKGAINAEKIYQESLLNGTKFMVLTASSDDDIENFKTKTKVTYPFCKTDPITLKTIVRANPGLVLIEAGTIIGKWNWRDF
ncbi:MAG: DoxX family protein [Paludibacter sp.]|nr:DoxX family protein [Paludibacter sp.]